MKRITLSALATALLCSALPASAHYLWIESARDGHARLYFGEIQEGAREKSPGRLDEMPGPAAWTPAGTGRRTLPVERRADHFDLGRVRAGTEVLVEERGYEVKDWSKHGIGVVKPVYYARAGRAARGAAPVLPLDLLPAAGAGEYRLTFAGTPLPKAKVMIYAPNTWMQELVTDDAGVVRVSTPWAGQYVLEAIHTEAAPGEFGGKKYDAVRHRMTLTVEAARDARR